MHIFPFVSGSNMAWQDIVGSCFYLKLCDFVHYRVFLALILICKNVA